jgi:CBS domain-containing protein
MTVLREIQLRPASVRENRSFLDAARALLAARVSAIAVLDRDERVVGLFTDDDLLAGLFPPYLDELRHTAFLVDDETLQASAEAAARETVGQHMRRPVTVEIDAGAAHVVERFLHTPWGAIAVVESGRFVGMVDQLDLISRLLGRADLPHR